MLFQLPIFIDLDVLFNLFYTIIILSMHYEIVEIDELLTASMTVGAQWSTPLWAGDGWGLSPALGGLVVVVGASRPFRIEGRLGFN